MKHDTQNKSGWEHNYPQFVGRLGEGSNSRQRGGEMAEVAAITQNQTRPIRTAFSSFRQQKNQYSRKTRKTRKKFEWISQLLGNTARQQK